MNGTGAVDMVAVVTSAGGLSALTAVLRELPLDLPAPVVVQQHMGAQDSALVPILQRRTGHDITWAVDGMALAAGQVVVCPPRRRLELLPDSTCAVIENGAGALDLPHDALLESLADAFGAAGLAVVLTGMGRDGAAGAARVKAAGGFVIAENADTAEHRSMPAAAAAAAHLVLPVGEIGPLIADVKRAADGHDGWPRGVR
jgi:chemotaxis response regulator CheB